MGPLNYLIQLQRAELLKVHFGGVWIPPAVLGELEASGSPAVVKTWLQNRPDWVQVKRAEPLNGLPLSLGAGECEAISLAVSLASDLLLMDDLAGRREADRRGLLTAGTLGLLKRAADLAQLDFRTEAVRLKNLGFRVTQDVIDRVSQQGSN